MALAGEVIHKSLLLVTVKFTDGDKELTRNYKLGDHDMLGRVIKSTQQVFLNKDYDRKAQSEYMRNRGQYEAEADAVKAEVVAQEAA